MNMGGMGTTITFVLAGILWFVYFIPSIRRKREYEATERNATRLAQTMRVLSQTMETPPEVIADVTAREVRARQRELQRIEREREWRVRSEVRGYDVAIAERRRRTKLMCTVLGLASVIAGVASAVTGLWVAVAVAAAFLAVAATGLVALNRTQHLESAPIARRDSDWATFAEETGRWTPNRMPAVRSAAERQPAGAGIVITPETEAEIAAKARAARVAAQQAAAQAAAEAAEHARPAVAAVDPRFAAMGMVSENTAITEGVAVLDIAAALRARRSS